MTKIRVLVVEDSITMRKCLVKTLCEDPEIEVIDEAENGSRAVELCHRLRPDVITLDMMMPVMTGLEATERIMAYTPTPILIVSSSVNRSELFKTYDALAAGAVDVMEKPNGDDGDNTWNAKFIAAVKRVSRIKVVTHLKGKLTTSLQKHPHSLGKGFSLQDGSHPRCVVIGVSTGGPKALVDIFSHLPKDFPLPIFVVIHIGQTFGQAFADWLDSLSPIRVAYAVDGDPFPAEPKILLAPPDRHLVLSEGRLRLTDAPERHSCRPSVDVFFESVARELKSRVIACLLTGMGRDGANGLLAIRRAGGATYVQDEASCVVFGMPREAILLGAAERVLALNDIAPMLLERVGYQEREGGTR